MFQRLHLGTVLYTPESFVSVQVYLWMPRRPRLDAIWRLYDSRLPMPCCRERRQRRRRARASTTLRTCTSSPTCWNESTPQCTRRQCPLRKVNQACCNLRVIAVVLTLCGTWFCPLSRTGFCSVSAPRLSAPFIFTCFRVSRGASCRVQDG